MRSPITRLGYFVVGASASLVISILVAGLVVGLTAASSRSGWVLTNFVFVVSLLALSRLLLHWEGATLREAARRRHAGSRSNLDVDAGLCGCQGLRWVGKVTLTGAAQLGYYVSGGNTIIRASTYADGKAKMEIQLSGVKVLTEGDSRF